MRFYSGVGVTVGFQSWLSYDCGKELRYIAKLLFFEEEAGWPLKGGVS